MNPAVVLQGMQATLEYLSYTGWEQEGWLSSFSVFPNLHNRNDRQAFHRFLGTGIHQPPRPYHDRHGLQ